MEQAAGMKETITGSGQLKINGEAMSISFTVPKGPCLPEALLPDAQRFANQITDVAVARVERAGHRISCAKGCGACCRQMVPISPPEARHLAALVEAMPEAQAAGVRTRFAAAREKVKASGLPPHGPADGDQTAFRAFGIAYFGLGVPCPFLVEESCSIHPDRPLVCREYLVTSPAAACGQLGSGKVQQIAVPRRVWAVFSRSTSADGGLEWMPLIEALDYAAKTAAPDPVRTGPQYVEALLKELGK
jgi:Fe-S-cluster containining protein